MRQANAQASTPIFDSEVASKRRYTEKGACSKFQTIILMIYICAMVKSRYIGDGHPTFNRNPYTGYINPYFWVDDHSLLYGNNGSLDPGTYLLCGMLGTMFQQATNYTNFGGLIVFLYHVKFQGSIYLCQSIKYLAISKRE